MLESVPRLFVPSDFMFGTQQVTLVSPRLTVISIFGEKINQQGRGRPQTERDEHELFFFS